MWHQSLGGKAVFDELYAQIEKQPKLLSIVKTINENDLSYADFTTPKQQSKPWI